MYSRYSPRFIEASLRSEFSPGDPMPCPRCDGTEVTYSDPRRWLKAAAGLAVVAVVAALAGQRNVTICTGLSAFLTGCCVFAIEPGYLCKGCGYGWRYRDAVKWAKAIRHDYGAAAERDRKQH
jgi:hypothetical protein